MKDNYFIVKLNWVDCITLLGLFFAASSCALSLSGKFEFSLSLLYIAMLADAFDGVLARKYGLGRDFGRYLDGFVDVADYLIAPSIFLYLWGFNTWYYGMVIVFFIMCGVIRLSVFNETGNLKDEDDGLSYWGMPVFWSAIFLGIFYILGWILPKGIIFPVIAVSLGVYSVLMIYNGRFFKFKDIKMMLFSILGGTLLFSLVGLAKEILY